MSRREIEEVGLVAKIIEIRNNTMTEICKISNNIKMVEEWVVVITEIPITIKVEVKVTKINLSSIRAAITKTMTIIDKVLALLDHITNITINKILLGQIMMEQILVKIKERKRRTIMIMIIATTIPTLTYKKQIGMINILLIKMIHSKE